MVPLRSERPPLNEEHDSVGKNDTKHCTPPSEVHVKRTGQVKVQTAAFLGPSYQNENVSKEVPFVSLPMTKYKRTFKKKDFFFSERIPFRTCLRASLSQV